MFDFKRLIEKIYDYGFCKLARDSNMDIKHLMEIIDGDTMFEGSEIMRVSDILGILDSEIDSFFFTNKIA